MMNGLPDPHTYALYNSEHGIGAVFELPEGKELTPEMLEVPWYVRRLEWAFVDPPPDEKPAVEPPIDLTAYLATNEDAAYPFPTLRQKNPEPPRPLSSIRYVTLHHSAGQRATTNIEYWHRLHTQTKSWSRVGYHIGIASLKQGDPIKLYLLNHLSEWSWHDSRNSDTIGVCMAGDLRTGHDIQPNEVQLECFGRCMAWLLPQLPELNNIVGHQLWQATACPGDIKRWWGLLVDAARQYGQDIEDLFLFERPVRVSLAQALRIKRVPGEPPPEHYEDV